MVLLGLWSVDQRQGLLFLISTSELQAARLAPYHRAPRLGPRAFSISRVNSLGGDLFAATFIHASNLTAALAEWLQLLNSWTYAVPEI